MGTKRLLWRAAFLLVAGLLILVGAPRFLGQEGGPVPIVFAASSLSDILREFGTSYRLHTGKAVDLRFGSSGDLRGRIEQGGGADLFISDSPGEVDALEEAGDVLARAALFRNRLVLVEPESRPGWEERMVAGEGVLRRPDLGRIAIGDPERIPAGRYAREALESMGIWEDVRGRLLPAPSDREIAERVARGETEMGISYLSDARAVEGVRILWTFRAESTSPIVYVGAVVRGGGHPAAAGEFLDYLRARERLGVIGEHGFLRPE